MQILSRIMLFFSIIPFVSCVNFATPTYTGSLRSFETSFETASDFDGFYIVPPGDYDSNHELSTDTVYSGTYAHKAWILNARAQNNDGIVYLPHRAYPTIQFQKRPDGIYRTPGLVTL